MLDYWLKIRFTANYPISDVYQKIKGEKFGKRNQLKIIGKRTVLRTYFSPSRLNC